VRTILSVAVAMAAVSAALAQELPVTGSHIAGAPSLSAVRVIERAQIEASGYATFGELLQRLPEQGAAQGPNVNNGADGSLQLALHQLGAQRTLVLVDGKRWVPYSTGGVADLQTIPTQAIERIEILESGGSAIYGPDAVGGVVNVITRKKVDATEISALGGLSTRGDAGRYGLGLTSGFSTDKLDVFGGVGFADRRPLVSATRGFASQPLLYDFASGAASAQGSPNVPSGSVVLNPGQCATATCRDLAQRFGNTGRIFVSLGNGSFRPIQPSDLYDSKRSIS
jgi:iron complex outermembrane receptor protein